MKIKNLTERAWKATLRLNRQKQALTYRIGCPIREAILRLTYIKPRSTIMNTSNACDASHSATTNAPQKLARRINLNY